MKSPAFWRGIFLVFWLTEAVNQESEGDRVFPKPFMSKLFAIIEAYREIYSAIVVK
ncbi:hypothetical protein [Microcoleus sp.]|uniref:hypothetical protein n=1 Tax=Microcoleus sp. TaxID=44472 RepID=UPI0035948E43